MGRLFIAALAIAAQLPPAGGNAPAALMLAQLAAFPGGLAGVYEETGRLVDPHTAVGITVARRTPVGDAPRVVMSTAHPAKFGEVVETTTGTAPELPERLASLIGRPEACVGLPNDTAAVASHVREVAVS